MKSKLHLFELFHIKEDIKDLEDISQSTELKVNQFKGDKDMASELLRQKKKDLKTASTHLENIEQDLHTVENKFREKETAFVTVKEQVSYWQKKLNSSNALLAEARRSNEVHIKTVQELEDEMRQIEDMKTTFEELVATQLLSQGSSIEFNNTQVQEYSRLKQAAQIQSLEDIKRCDSLKRQQTTDQDKLDNENRKKLELENKLQQKKILLDETEKRFNKLQQYVKETEEVLMSKTTARANIQETVSEQKDKIESVQNELQQVSELLENAKTDNYMISRLKKKAETVNTLKGLHSNVYGRLYDMCKPIHSRYGVAVAKVLGKHMDSIVVATTKVAMQCINYLREQQIDVETFLPLDSLKTEPLKEILRDIKEPKGVKLLYDVLQFSPKEINNAILFATKNTLACETPEDARMIAYEIDPKYRSNAVALDGTFYSKSGTFSGGQSDLSKRAKIWEDNQLSELKSKKVMLIEQLRQMSRVPEVESELRLTDQQIHGLTNRLKYSKYSLTDTEQQITKFQNELEVIENDLKVVCNNVTSIKATMEERKRSIENIEKLINDAEDTVFEDFCNTIGLNNIREYEKRNLRVHHEQTKRRLELDGLYDRLRNLLDFEKTRDTESAILKSESAVKTAERELEAAGHKEASSKTDIEKEQQNLNGLRARCKSAKTEVTEKEKDIHECRRRIGVIARLIQHHQRERIAILTNIEKKKAECHALLRNIETEDIAIPGRSSSMRSTIEDIQHSFTSDSSSITKDRLNQEMLSRIDFTKLPESLKSRMEEEIRNSRSQLVTEIAEIQNSMQHIKNPNFKASEKVNLMVEQLKETKAEFEERHKEAKTIKGQFENVKQERYNRFMNCLEHVVTALDPIYKCLVNDQSAQAILVPENPEEPYLGGINYSCIVPRKGFHVISNLSGGEKTLVALALLFAMHRCAANTAIRVLIFKPTPFFVMDEVDAALDQANIRNLVRFISSKTIEMQFIIISLNKYLKPHADILIGICSDLSGESPESLVFTLPLRQYSLKRVE